MGKDIKKIEAKFLKDMAKLTAILGGQAAFSPLKIANTEVRGLIEELAAEEKKALKEEFSKEMEGLFGIIKNIETIERDYLATITSQPVEEVEVENTAETLAENNEETQDNINPAE